MQVLHYSMADWKWWPMSLSSSRNVNCQQWLQPWPWTGSAWGSLMLACHRRLGGGVIRWLIADEEDRSSGSATFAAACRTSTCCKITCAQAFRVGCVKSHGTLVRASAAKWYVPCCRMSAGMLYTTSTFVTGLTAGITLPYALQSLANRMRRRMARSATLCKVGLCQELALQ